MCPPSVQHLKVWVKNDTNDVDLENSFNRKDLVFKILPEDANDHKTYPMYSAKAAIKHNNRTIDLGNVTSPVYALTSTYWNVADLNGDGAVNNDDFIFFLQGTETTGPSRRDVANADGILGLPDNEINDKDGKTIVKEIYLQDTNQPVNGHYGLEDGFENGFQYWWKNDANNPWTIENGVARSGQILDGETSAMEFDVHLDRPGTLSFKIETSSEGGFDHGNLYVNGMRLKRWSGINNRQEEIFHLVPGDSTSGNFNIQFTYEKRASEVGFDTAGGEDAVWIDDFKILPEYIRAKAQNN